MGEVVEHTTTLEVYDFRFSGTGPDGQELVLLIDGRCRHAALYWETVGQGCQALLDVPAPQKVLRVNGDQKVGCVRLVENDLHQCACGCHQDLSGLGVGVLALLRAVGVSGFGIVTGVLRIEHLSLLEHIFAQSLNLQCVDFNFLIGFSLPDGDLLASNKQLSSLIIKRGRAELWSMNSVSDIFNYLNLLQS